MDKMVVCTYCNEVCDPMHHECGETPQAWGFVPPVYKWQIQVGGERGVQVAMETEPPNRLQRFMYKLLLGWEINLL